MTFSQFEKHAAGKISNHASNVDAEALWNNVLPHVQTGNNRRRGLIWFFFVGVLVAFAGIYALTNGENSNPKNDATALSTINLTQEDNEAKSVEKELATTSTQEIEKPNPAKTTQTINTKSTANKAGEGQQKNNFQQKKYKATSLVRPLAREVAIFENAPVENVPVANATNETPLLSEEDAEVATSDLESNNHPFEIGEPNENKEVIPADTTATILAAEGKVALEMESANEPTLKILEDAAEDNEDDFRPRNKLLRIKFGVGVYGGLGSSFSSLKTKDPLDDEYLQMRLQTEEQLETIRMGLELIAKSELGLYFKTGVQFSRIARKFTFRSDIVTVDSIHGVTQIYVNTNTNDSIFIYGQIPVTTTTSYNKETYNNFNMLDIPLLVGYTHNHENWSFGVEGGALINISTKTKGEIFDRNNEIYDIKEDPNEWYKSNVGVSFTASVYAAYHLSDNLQIYLAPTVRMESIFSTAANPIAQKHGELGINVGARYFIGY